MPCDLRLTFGPLAAGLPDDPAQQVRALEIAASEIPLARERMRSDQICATSDRHFYGDIPVDAVSLELDRATCRHLGLWILTRVLHPAPQVMELELVHPRSTIRRIVMRANGNQERDGDRESAPAFNYRARHPARYPWLEAGIPTHDMAVLTTTTRARSGVKASQTMPRDTLVGFGAAQGTRLLATLLLDAGLPTNPGREYRLEGEHGLGGVGPGSEELSVWLPGSIGHLDTPMVD